MSKRPGRGSRKRLAAERSCRTGEFLGWSGKESRSARSNRQDGIFSRSEFHWHRQRGVCICRSGKTGGTLHDEQAKFYRALKRHWDACSIWSKCCATAAARKISCDIHENAQSRTSVDEDKSVRQIARPEKACRDAVHASQDPTTASNA